MCGIAGIDRTRREALPPPGLADVSRRWRARCTTAAPTSSASTATRRAGPRARAALDHRPRDRAAADGQRGRHAVDRVQRRDLQLRRAARRAASRSAIGSARSSDTEVDRPRLRGVGRRPRSSASTASGRIALWDRRASDAGAGARPARRASAVPVRARRAALVRERGEGDLRRRSRRSLARSTRPASTRPSPSGRRCPPQAVFAGVARARARATSGS